MNGSYLNNSEHLQSPTFDSTTIVKYEKSSCLFCNEWFDSQTFTEHLIHCGQVLEQCPNNCNAFLPRIRMRSHLKECSSQTCKSVSLERIDSQGDHRVEVLESEIKTLRTVLNEEIRQRLHLITDVGNLRKQNQIHDEWSQTMEESINSLQKRFQNDNVQHYFEVEQCQQDFHYCYDMIQTLKTEIQNEIIDLEKQMKQMSGETTQHQHELKDNIMKVEETILQHDKSNRDKFVEIEKFLQEINVDVNTKLNRNEWNIEKNATLDFEVKSIKHIVCETEERCEKLERLMDKIDSDLHQTIQLVTDLENYIVTQQRLNSFANSRGHLIWRIKDFSKQLEDSKLYNTIIHSAMFSNKPFGYSLGLDIYPNGKGTWKGRNMIACLNVLTGEYDPLLSWPCRLQADIKIRDQTDNPNEAQDYIKTVNVRKRSDDSIQSKQLFYIPHAILLQRKKLRMTAFL